LVSEKTFLSEVLLLIKAKREKREEETVLLVLNSKFLNKASWKC